MNIGELRLMMDAALRIEGLEERRLIPKRPKVWTLPADDIIPYFHAGPYRRPWGFVYTGGIGVEIPTLRAWLDRHKPGDAAGIFRTAFVGYHIMNEDVIGEFFVNHGDPVPADLWAGLIKDRLLQIPPSLAGLITAYRGNREELGWLAHPHSRHAWEFLLKWHENPDPSLHVPQMLPNGRIV